MKDKKIKLMLKDGSEYEALSFGADKSVAGEVVFATGMAGYPEALTDPSFAGQILVLTYPLIGNYGVPAEAELESKKVQVAGLIVANYIDTPSHHTSKMTLGAWLRQSGVPLLEVKDTREITQKLREQGVMLGKIVFGRENIPFYNPNRANLVAQVSAKKIQMYGTAGPTVILIDCGAKLNIVRRLAARGLRVAVVPWDTDVTRLPFPFLAVIISNGPGPPKKPPRHYPERQKNYCQKNSDSGHLPGQSDFCASPGWHHLQAQVWPQKPEPAQIGEQKWPGISHYPKSRLRGKENSKGVPRMVL